MKKNRLIPAILAVLLVISLWMNVQHYAEAERTRRMLFNGLYHQLSNAAFNLDGLLTNLENGVTEDATIRQMLGNVADGFLQVDTILGQYATYFPEERVHFVSTFGFEFIAYSLGGGGGTASGARYRGVLADDVISERDVQYITALRDGANGLVSQMQNPETGLGEDPKLTIDRLNRILGEFFDVWSFHNEGGPYYLLLD